MPKGNSGTENKIKKSGESSHILRLELPLDVRVEQRELYITINFFFNAYRFFLTNKKKLFALYTKLLESKSYFLRPY